MECIATKLEGSADDVLMDVAGSLTLGCDRREMRTLPASPEIRGLQQLNLRPGHFFLESVHISCKSSSESVHIKAHILESVRIDANSASTPISRGSAAARIALFAVEPGKNQLFFQ